MLDGGIGQVCLMDGWANCALGRDGHTVFDGGIGQVVVCSWKDWPSVDELTRDHKTKQVFLCFPNPFVPCFYAVLKVSRGWWWRWCTDQSSLSHASMCWSFLLSLDTCLGLSLLFEDVFLLVWWRVVWWHLTVWAVVRGNESVLIFLSLTPQTTHQHLI